MKLPVKGIRMERHTDISYLERDILDGIIRRTQALILGEIKTLLSLYHFIKSASFMSKVDNSKK